MIFFKLDNTHILYWCLPTSIVYISTFYTNTYIGLHVKPKNQVQNVDRLEYIDVRNKLLEELIHYLYTVVKNG